MNMKNQEAIFAAGCFWGVQDYFDQVPGVVETEVGYTGGHVDQPTYDQVCAHTTGHAEAVRVVFDTAKVSYETLLKQFFHLHDPTQLNRQGPDVGDNYRSAVFYEDEEQKATAQKLIEQLDKSGDYKKPIVTTLEPAAKFWRAEEFHQKFVQGTGHGACHINYSPV
ncbi:MAG: peptide-methionine (S)-S-oxide reductase MsrA [Candidatus Saccharimonadales bacterium]